MLRAWLRAGLCVCAVSFVGCGGDSRENIVANTTTQITQAATSLGNIKAKVEEFVKKKEAKDEEAEMKALRYFFCIVLPPLAVLLTGRIASFFLSLILTLLGWIPGVIHACLVVNDYHAEQRAAAR